MALIVLASANGSPGATTTALGLAMAWPRAVLLVDADPTGARAIPAGYLRGGQLPTDATIVDLAIAHRQGVLSEELPRALMRIPGTEIQLLCGPLRHTQARALENLWEPLAGAFKGLERNGQDVIVDAGRLGLDGSPFNLLLAADLALLVTRSTLPGLVGASSWAPTLAEAFERVGAVANLGVLVVGERMPYSAGETSKVLQLPVVANVAFDPQSAQVYSHGAKPGRKFATSALNKSLQACAQGIRSTISASRASLGLAQERNHR